MIDHSSFYQRSLAEPDAFWAEQAALIDWHRPFDQVCDYSHPPFARWFVGAQTNLCHNAVDRHLAERADQSALIWASSETDQELIYSYGELHAEVQRMAAVLQSLGVQHGDRVLIYLPMVPQAVFAMLACARIGAIHCVVFGGFASASLATRIDDARPVVIVSADAGSRSGKVIAYKPLLDEAMRLAAHPPAKVLLVDRGLCPMDLVPGRDEDYAALRQTHLDAVVSCVWVDATHPSYTMYTSGTTGKPKGVQRDTGGYAVALAASMKHIFDGRPGETFFSGSDIGWVLGHSYIVYGPLIAGMATILYEGLPTRPDAGVWWSLVERHQVSVMFTSPTAIRVLKKSDPKHLTQYDLGSLRQLFLAGEPVDVPTSSWISNALGKPVVDNYWQTETGWPILALSQGLGQASAKPGSPGFAVYGYRVRILDEASGEELTTPNCKGVLTIDGPLPPGCMQTVWRDDERFIKTYWTQHSDRWVYNTFDWGLRDEDGYHFILGRTDDVINVASHRLGTREIEEVVGSHAAVAEVAVVGVADAVKGQVPMAFAVLKDASAASTEPAARRIEDEIMKLVDARIGPVARPARVLFVGLLPKTRSGKLLRRTIQALCEQRDPGDLTTLDDADALRQVRAALAG